MVKVPFVVFSLALVLSIQFVVGQDEKALDEAASPKAEDVLLSSESVDRPTSSFAAEIATSPESKVEVATEFADGPPSGLADEIAASPVLQVEVATESIGGRKRKMA
ncbi:hypothetical protein Gotur_002885 [Gossypium turneri]